MSTLKEGLNLELSSGQRDAGDKTIVFVKLTDAAAKSLDECVLTKEIPVFRPIMQFECSTGMLKLPIKGMRNKSYGFALSRVEGDASQGSFECLHHQNIKSLESLGAMILKIQINANEDTYENTRVKMAAAAEEESKKYCTKEIASSSSYTGKMLKMKRPAISMLPKLCSPLHKTDKTISRTENSSSLEGKFTNLEEDAYDNVFSKFRANSGNTQNMLEDEATHEKIEEILEKIAHADVSDENNSAIGCTPHIKKLKLAEKIMNTALLDSQEKIDDNCCKKNGMVMENIGLSNSSAKGLADDCEIKDSLLSEEENAYDYNKLETNKGEISFEKENHSHLYTSKSYTEYNRHGYFGKQEILCDDPIFCEILDNYEREKSDESIDDTRENHLHSNSSSLSNNSINSPEDAEDSELSEDLMYPLDYANTFVKITSQQQRESYKLAFDVDYEQYKVLHSFVKQAAVKFSAFENELKRYKPGSEQHMKIKEQICQAYLLNSSDQTYQEAYSQLHYLHGKLSHIKRLVLAYDKLLPVEETV